MATKRTNISSATTSAALPLEPSIGRIVRYVEGGGAVWAAIITCVHPNRAVNLCAFMTNGHTTTCERVPFNKEQKPYTWHPV